MRRAMKTVAYLGVFSFLFVYSGCTGTDSLFANPDPDPGQTSFISADAYGGQRSEENGYGDPGLAADEDGAGKDDGRTVEEGDIYRVLNGSLILNLNSYRGLQVIDFSDVTDPQVTGRLRVSGYPVEMYVVGTQAIVLMNNYQAYYGTRSSVDVDSYYGGLVLTVDISDPLNPVMVDQAQVPGWISTSRLVKGGGKQSVYVAANNYDDGYSTVVRSFAITDAGDLIKRTTVDLGGYVADIQATTEALLVARYDWNNNEGRSSVSLLDISNVDGYMVEGAEVLMAGLVSHKSNMNLYNGILRVASSGSWSGSSYNHVETFEVSDIQNPLPLDHDTFGHGEDLYATLFLENKAFFVTYRRVDPFHAFSIDDNGQAIEQAEYVISGWNDFFRPVLDDTRLIGIGVDDENGWSMAVSLYDITDLSNQEPFITRANVGADHSWSEARYDDRAFSILDGVVSVPGPDGQTETGLVLLPFSGYSDNYDGYMAGVQIFTYSESSLTQRGVMDHGSWVTRSFQADDDLTANLSESTLSLYDASDPDAPAHQGTVQLAPNYTDFLVFGDYGARLRYDRDYYWWWGASADLPGNVLEIVSMDEHPDQAPTVATLELPTYAQVYKVGNNLVAVESQWVELTEDEYGYETTLTTFDMSDPTQPSELGSLTTDEIQPYYGYYGGYYPEMDGCWDCGRYYYGGGTSAYTVGQSLVFPANVWEQELTGIEHVCRTYPRDGSWDEECVEDEYGAVQCTYYYGSITCRSLNGEPETCTGQLQRCITDDYGWSDWICEDIDPDEVETETNCYDYERYRYWTHFDINVVDLSDPTDMNVAPTIQMPVEEEAVSVMAQGHDLYVSYKMPVNVSGDTRDYVRYFFKSIDLSVPSSPLVSSGVNVPGELIAVDGDTLFTRDFIWGDTIVESAINKLSLSGNVATLLGRQRFSDRQVNSMMLDGAGHALVSHRLSWYAIDQDPDLDWEDMVETLSVLDAVSDDLEKLSEVEIADWAYLREATLGRALYTVPGGLLVVNLDVPSVPFAQAFFPVLGWPSRLHVEGDEIIFPAGRYGIYQFDINAFTLVAPLTETNAGN